ncbi:MAG: RNA 3'-terminal phosphate cyclase [Acidimicrobiia bacterium]|nr:RNA 3'-terminal phosphate cyclase [Acidimicrobiia bacterium]
MAAPDPGEEERVEIDGASHSGSGTIVRTCVAYAALTGRAVHLVRMRARRPRPGLRRQHLRAVTAVRELVGGELTGAGLGSRELTFVPGPRRPAGPYRFDIGSAGSVTALATALLPVLTRASAPVEIELRGGLFQDHAPTALHLQHVLLRTLTEMGLDAVATIERPGYVPSGEGVLRLAVGPSEGSLRPLVREEAAPVERIWGIALASHLVERRVATRMAETARAVLAAAGYDADIETREDTTATQAGAALALFADLRGGARLGADMAGARGRPAERIGREVATRLLEDLGRGATVDRFAADQLVPFAAIAAGETRLRVPVVTEHLTTACWLAGAFLPVEARLDDGLLVVEGCGSPGW